MKKAELLINLGGVIGEGICWDETGGMLYWIDLLADKIYSYDISISTVEILDVGQNTGCIAVREKGGLIAGLQHGIYFVDMKTGRMELAASPEVDKPGNRFNDGECDCMGRFFAGTMSKTLDSGAGDTAPRGALYRMDPDGRVEKVIDHVTISNGIGYSPDNTVMYYIDSPTQRVDAFDYDKQTGAIRGRRTARRIF